MPHTEMIRRIVLSVFLLFAYALSAAPSRKNENMVVNPFRKELLPATGAKIDSHGGRNGTPGLVLFRKKGDNYTFYNLPVDGLKPLHKYKFGAWIKTKDVKPGYRGATMTVNFVHDNGQAYDSERPFPYGFVGTNDWTLLEYEVTAPAKFHHATLGLYIGYEGTGEAVYSEPFLMEVAPVWATTLIYPPMRFAIEPGTHRFEFNSYPQNLDLADAKEARVAIVDSQGNTIFKDTVPIEKNRYSVKANLPEGKYVAKLTLLPAKLKTELKMNVVEPCKEAHVSLDGKGRFIVNGKPFLPVGIYTNMERLRISKRDEQNKPVEWEGTWNEYDTKDIIENSPFNVILPYDGFWWHLEKPDLKCFAATEYMLDLMQKHNKMLILSVKDFNPKRINNFPVEGIEGSANITRAAVERFRNHPALLAWYLNDETDVQGYEAEQVELVGELDPHHPSIQVQYRSNLQFSALNGGDIIGLDLYPIKNEASDQQVVCEIFQSLRDSFGSRKGVVVCAVPQVMSWYVYSHSNPPYLPTVPQMRSVALMMAAYGAKSFVFFAHSPLVHTPEHFDVSFKKVWKDACDTAQTIRDLEPYILGEKEMSTPGMNVKSGGPVARVLTADNGKQAVLITTVGKGKTDVVIQLDRRRKYQSKYGRTKALGEGKYQFTCDYLDCDVLVEKP